MPTEAEIRAELRRLRDRELKEINDQFRPLIQDTKRNRTRGLAEIEQAGRLNRASLDQLLQDFTTQQTAINSRINRSVAGLGAAGTADVAELQALQSGLSDRLGGITSQNLQGLGQLNSALAQSSATSLRNNTRDLLTQLRSGRADARRDVRSEFRDAIAQIRLQGLAGGGGGGGGGGRRSGGGGGGGGRRSAAEEQASLEEAAVLAGYVMTQFPDAVAQFGNDEQQIYDALTVLFAGTDDSRRDNLLSQIEDRQDIFIEEQKAQAEQALAEQERNAAAQTIVDTAAKQGIVVGFEEAYAAADDPTGFLRDVGAIMTPKEELEFQQLNQQFEAERRNDISLAQRIDEQGEEAVRQQLADRGLEIEEIEEKFNRASPHLLEIDQERAKAEFDEILQRGLDIGRSQLGEPSRTRSADREGNARGRTLEERSPLIRARTEQQGGPRARSILEGRLGGENQTTARFTQRGGQGFSRDFIDGLRESFGLATGEARQRQSQRNAKVDSEDPRLNGTIDNRPPSRPTTPPRPGNRFVRAF